MIFLSAQPFDLYFQWQIEVQIVNFRKFGVSDKMHVLVWYPEESEMTERDNKTGRIVREFKTPPNLSGWETLRIKYPEVKFFLYKDDGVDLSLYIPQLRPQIIKTHFLAHPELEKEVIFYHDSDIIFNFLPNFEELAEGPINYQSDCSHYLDYKYLRDKEIQGNIPENEAIGILAGIGNTTVDVIKSYKGNTGGAQCLLKGVDSAFWKDVELQCIKIRKAFTHITAPNVKKTPENLITLKNSVNTIYFPDENAGYQSWCADMWALNMALWSRGKVTKVIPELDFSWATDDLNTYNRKPIYHNAGATRLTPHLFYKANWMDKSPIGKPLKSSKNTAQQEYIKAIQAVK